MWLHKVRWEERGCGCEVSPWPAAAVLEKAEVVEEERSGNHLFVVISSDRGLCGSIHSNLARTIRPIMEQRSSSANTYFVCVGDKVIPHHMLLTLTLPTGCRSVQFCNEH